MVVTISGGRYVGGGGRLMTAHWNLRSYNASADLFWATADASAWSYPRPKGIRHFFGGEDVTSGDRVAKMKVIT